MKIALVPISAKPYHAGHHYLVTKAAQQNDKVILFVSVSSRQRKGEFPIFGDDMLRIWTEELESIMPANVEIEFGGNPVRKVYEIIGDACQRPAFEDTYVVYSDVADTATNYPQAHRERYMQPLCHHDQVKFAAEENPDDFMRGSGAPNISGTRVRKFLENEDFKSFATAMPPGVNANNIWNILTHKTDETLLRNLIQTIIS
tara:strand:- start:1995 stop:2600 length:606 start_codon:yes stop_codon:yes gene_type:complete